MSNISSIRKVEHEGERFYNLAVEEDESYIANGIVVHNCRSQLVYVTKADVEIDGIEPSKEPNLQKLQGLPGVSSQKRSFV